MDLQLPAMTDNMDSCTCALDICDTGSVKIAASLTTVTSVDTASDIHVQHFQATLHTRVQAVLTETTTNMIKKQRNNL